MEQIECSETSTYKIQTPGNHPEENIQHTEHGESLKSKIEHEVFAESPVFVTAFDEHPDNDSDFLSHVIFCA
jgi:hypothetical protein